MATTAQYTTQPILNYAQVSSSNNALDGSGTEGTTIIKVIDGPTTAAAAGVGERINRVIVQAAGTTIAGMIRFFLTLNGGTTKRLIVEKPVSAITVGASTAAFRTEVPELVGLILVGGGDAELYASTHIAETFNIIIESGRL